MSIDGFTLPSTYSNLIEAILAKAVELKEDGAIEPPLTESDLGTFVQDIEATRSSAGGAEKAQTHDAAIETAVREKFYDILASTSIDEPAFGQVWNLLDVISIISDRDLCEAGLVFWLIEELLDSQTIEGCDVIFDFLESRRERITGKHFDKKKLIILRTCSDLLRRLSRAENTVFAGRVFIFLFQSFPLGDKSSVNLRGEFHIENVTVFDGIKAKAENDDASMTVDGDSIASPPDEKNSGAGKAEDFKNKASNSSKPTNGAITTTNGDAEIDLDELYPVFWGLQSDFSAPTRLFNRSNLQNFKRGLEATIDCFQKIPISAAPGSKHYEEPQTGDKRKRGAGSLLSNMFNPKYLTSRELFELEIHDIAFRRNVLVQALIILEFLLSLTGAKPQLPNKSVLYAFMLSEEDTKWAMSTKASIADYLQHGASNGKFYYRMVDTVLSRDKNWVRWKAEGCPQIQRPPVNTQQHQAAWTALKKLCRTPELPQPMGALDFSFLTKDTGLEGLKDPDRFRVPASESFYDGIMSDDLDAEMGTEEEMQMARDSRETKIWKALRASSNRFQLCESLDNNKNLKALASKTASPPPPPPEEADSSAAAG